MWRNYDGFFITGTDTEVGKTLISIIILKKLGKKIKKVLPFKPVVAGVYKKEGIKFNEDLVVLKRYSSEKLEFNEFCPYILETPASPNFSALKDNIKIDQKVIYKSYELIYQRSNFIVVEGVGGFIVPFSDNFNSGDFAKKINLPVIIVVGIRLGCLNHAFLTLESVIRRKLKVIGWVANCIEPNMKMQEENIKFLKNSFSFPCLGSIPFADTDISKTPYHDEFVKKCEKYIDLNKI